MKRVSVISVIAAAALLAGLSACSTTSHVITGNTLPPLTPDQVKLYDKPPAKYQEIGVVEASSKYSFTFSQQAMTDKAIERLKAEAARLGANGILLSGIGNTSGGSAVSVGSGLGTFSGNSAFGLGIGLSSIGSDARSVRGVAIHVIEEGTPATTQTPASAPASTSSSAPAPATTNAPPAATNAPPATSGAQ